MSAQPSPAERTSGAPQPDELSLAEIEQLLDQVSGASGQTATPVTGDDGSGLPLIDIEAAFAEDEAGQPEQAIARLRPDWQDEWDEQQVPYVRLLVERCRKLVVSTTGAKLRRRLIRWCFGKLPGWGRPFATFEDCCYQLRVRPYVVQAMIQHQWFRHGVVLTESLPTLADPLHEGILTEAIAYSFDAGAAVAETVWRHPSMFVSDVLAQASGRGVTANQADTGVASLTEAGLLGMRDGRVWFTGRSPEFMARRRTSFAQSFIEPQYPPAPMAGGGLTPAEAAILMGSP